MRAGNRNSERRQPLRERRRIPGETNNQNEIDHKDGPAGSFRQPKGTPADIVETLNRETNAGLADPTIKARLDDMGGMALTGSPADFGKLISDETEKWGKVIRDAGIKAE